MLSRRTFILSTTLAMGGVITGICLFKSKAETSREQAVNKLVESLAELPGAIRFGNIFLNQQHKDQIPIVSLKGLCKRLYDTYGDFNSDDIGEALEQQIQNELRTKNVQKIDDWYLARTEAGLCALAYIKKQSNS